MPDVFKELQITVYDVFGFLLPGSVVAVAVAVGFWAVLWPAGTLFIPLQLPALAVSYLLLISYLCGHLAQAMSNIVERWSKSSTRFESKIPLSPPLEKILRESSAKHFGAAAGELSAKELYLLCDQALVHNHSVGERDVFIYREGFYRGNSVALAFLAMSLGIRLFHSPAIISIGQKVVALHRSEVALAGAFTAAGSWLAYRRYLRFREHKFQTCFLRFLSLWTPSPSAGSNDDSTKGREMA
jgi:hypothetical protein